MTCYVQHSIEVDGRAYTMAFPGVVRVGDLVPIDPSGDRWAKVDLVIQPYREGGAVRVIALPTDPPPPPPA